MLMLLLLPHRALTPVEGDAAAAAAVAVPIPDQSRLSVTLLTA